MHVRSLKLIENCVRQSVVGMSFDYQVGAFVCLVCLPCVCEHASLCMRVCSIYLLCICVITRVHMCVAVHGAHAGGAQVLNLVGYSCYVGESLESERGVMRA